jgi:HAD superfamily hydrolase (TIGR01549 family)
LKTGIISTGYEVDVYAVLEKVSLPREFFDVIVGADTVKKVKPHPEVFRFALRKLRVKPIEALFIGDQVDVDYKGAEEVGITPVLIQRTDTEVSEVTGLRVIKGLEGVLQFI